MYHIHAYDANSQEFYPYPKETRQPDIGIRAYTWQLVRERIDRRTQADRMSGKRAGIAYLGWIVQFTQHVSSRPQLG